MHRFRLGIGLTLTLTLGACGGDDSGSDDAAGSSSSGASSSGTGTDETAGALACETCAPAAPEGWVGPFQGLSLFASAGTQCSGSFPDQIDLVFRQIDAEDPTCGCECGKPGGTCGSVTAAYQDAATCDGKPVGDDVELTPDTCASLADSADVALGLSVSATAAPAGCPPMPMTQIPTASFDRKLIACGAATEMCEAGGTCVPGEEGVDPYEVCVIAEGDMACPPQYPAKELYFREIDDTRDCSPCACEGELTCTGSVDLFAEADCMGKPATTIDTSADACISAPPPFMMGETPSALYTVEFAGRCTPAGGEAVGTAVEEEPVTVCCLAEAPPMP